MYDRILNAPNTTIVGPGLMPEQRYRGAVETAAVATGLNALRNRVDELNASLNGALESLEMTADRVLGSTPTACDGDKRPSAPGVLGDTNDALDRTEQLLKRLHSAAARLSIL